MTEVKTIFEPAVPCASRVPSTVRLVPLNCTTVPAWIVSVTPCACAARANVAAVSAAKRDFAFIFVLLGPASREA